MFSIDFLGLGKSPVTGGDLIRVKFVLQRIVGEVKVKEDIDKLTLSYIPHLYHCSCLGFEFFAAMIVKGEGSFLFHPSVYFHPNVCVDGFEEFRNYYQTLKGCWETAKEEYDRKMRKGRGRKRRGMKRIGLCLVTLSQIFLTIHPSGIFPISHSLSLSLSLSHS